jgi:hypothetical protein
MISVKRINVYESLYSSASDAEKNLFSYWKCSKYWHDRVRYVKWKTDNGLGFENQQKGADLFILSED